MTRPARSVSSAASDEALKQALRALPPVAPGDELDLLGTRVLAQWQARHPGPAAAAKRPPWRRPLWVGTAGLAAAAALATVLLVNRPDPALDELMQPDVLSQMAIGEM